VSRAIWWIRRDLRLHDNGALQAALDHAREVIPVWIFDPLLLQSPYAGEKRVAFLRQGLHALDGELRARGSRLLVRHGRPTDVLPRLLRETGATAVFAEADYTPYALRRDRALARLVLLHLHDGVAVYPPGTVVKANGEPYVSFSAFRRTWLSLPPLGDGALVPAPSRLPTYPAIDGEPVEPVAPHDIAMEFPAGEAEALRRLDDFVSSGLATYGQRRNTLDQSGTSSLSPYLRFGMLSPRRAAAAAVAAGAQAWLAELIWRDFFIHVLYHFPFVRDQSFRAQYRSLTWRQEPPLLAAWQEGRTGYPVVDAAMRQLNTTGWIHNRARMIAASFLTKDLLLDWREGERWFRQQLLDGDLALNNGNWQWVAGTGSDAAPYFRIFNPVTQGKKYDPEGQYIRRWLPELANVPAKYLYEPWQMPRGVQEKAHCRIGQDYPQPVCDHRETRQRALAHYRSLPANAAATRPHHSLQGERLPLESEIL
jgi:deoxyribodipyrimidine photo-lyase